MMNKKIYLLISLILVLLTFSTALKASEDFQLVVYGGEPAGIMAAVSSARKGLNTALIMERENPGGLMTYGALNYLDLNYGADSKILNRGLFYEWYKKMGSNVVFSIDKAESVFNEMLQTEINKNRLKIFSSSKVEKINFQDDELKKIYIKGTRTAKWISGNFFIDASKDANLAIMSGADFFRGGEDIGLSDRHMAVTLILHFGNIDWDLLKYDVKSNKYGPSYMDNNHAWGFVELGKGYKPMHDNMKLRGLNIVYHDNELNEVFINALLIFDVDPSNENELIKAYEDGKKEAENILMYLRKKLKGFSKAILLDFPEELYIRENVHIVSHKQLSVRDLFENSFYYDTIALGSYPLDYQASTKDYNGFVLFNPIKYGISLRSLIPAGIDNMLVVGKSSGYNSLAAASARVLAVGMSTGEAAGQAAHLALKNNLNFVELYKSKKLMLELQEGLNLNLNIEPKDPLIDDSVLLPYLEELLSWGLVIGGYNNNFNLEEKISEREFAHIIIKGLKRKKAEILYEWVPGSLETLSTNNKLDLQNASKLLLAARSQRVLDMDNTLYLEKALEMDLLPLFIMDNINLKDFLTRRQAYIIIGYLLKKYPVDDRLKYIRRGYVCE